MGTAYTRRSSFEVYGRGDRKLTDYWSSGLRTLHGFYSHGFPNCFHLGLTQNTFTPNFPRPLLDEQARHVADVVKAASEQQAQMVEPTPEAESGWLEHPRTDRQPPARRRSRTRRDGEGVSGNSPRRIE